MARSDAGPLAPDPFEVSGGAQGVMAAASGKVSSEFSLGIVPEVALGMVGPP